MRFPHTMIRVNDLDEAVRCFGYRRFCGKKNNRLRRFTVAKIFKGRKVFQDGKSFDQCFGSFGLIV